MKLLVTGGAGYIGSHTCKALAQSGHEVLVYDNLSTGHRDFVRWGDFIHGDIRDSQAVRSALRRHRPDGIIHFAAKDYVGESVLDPGKYFSNNVAGTLTVLEAMMDEAVPAIVESGTCAVYGQPEQVPITEACIKQPLNPYGASKLFMERMLEGFATAHGLRWMSLRYFNAAGSSQERDIGERHDPETHLIPRVIMAILGRIPAIEVFGTNYQTEDGTCIRDYIHVEDLSTAHIRAMEQILNSNENMAINLGTGTGSSVREIINGIEAISGKHVPGIYGERRAGDPAVVVADPAKAKTVLGWESQKHLADMLSDAWRYISSN